MSMALELKMKELQETCARLSDRIDAFEKRCAELDRRLAQKLTEAVDETLAESRIPVPAVPKALRDLGLGPRTKAKMKEA